MSVSLLHRPVCASCRRSSAFRYISTALARKPDPHYVAEPVENVSRQTKSRKVKKMQPFDVDKRHILDFTKVQDYLDSVAATRNTVTIADVERRRPAKHAIPGTPQYATEYNNLVDTLVLSFSQKQLREFVKLYGLEPPKDKKGKYGWAMTIMEKQWDWPSLSEIEQRQRDWTEVSFMSTSLLIFPDKCLHSISIPSRYTPVILDSRQRFVFPIITVHNYEYACLQMARIFSRYPTNTKCTYHFLRIQCV